MMARSEVRTVTGAVVPAVTAKEMREVDRVATEEVGLGLGQMMENAGRTLAWHVREVQDGSVGIVAGNGGNGGGGLVCARHLVNHGISVSVCLDRPADTLTGVTGDQYAILEAMDVPIVGPEEVGSLEVSVIVDALIGYGLRGPVREPARGLIQWMNEQVESVVSLDVPSGIDATTGEAAGPVVGPVRTVTLALPKTGLEGVDGRVFLADISIPATVFDRVGIDYASPFTGAYWVELEL